MTQIAKSQDANSQNQTPQIWQNILDKLKIEMPNLEQKSWLSGLEITTNLNEITLKFANEYSLKRFNSTDKDKPLETLKNILRVINPKLKLITSSKETKQTTTGLSKPQFNIPQPKQIELQLTTKGPLYAPKLNPNSNLSNFVKGPENQEALALAKSFCDPKHKPIPIKDILYISGTYGTGKTFLTMGIHNEALKNKLKSIWISGESLKNL